MKLYVVLAGLLAYYQPSGYPLQALLLTGSGVHAGMEESTGELPRPHEARMILSPQGYPKDENGNPREAFWVIDGDTVVINASVTSGHEAVPMAGTNGWRPLYIDEVVSSARVRDECLAADALAKCTKEERPLLRAKVVINGSFNVIPLEVDRDVFAARRDVTLVSILRSLETGQAHSMGSGRYAAGLLAVSTANLTSPPLVRIGRYDEVLAPSSVTDCVKLDPAAIGRCYIVRISNFRAAPPADQESERKFDPIDRDFAHFYDLLTAPPPQTWVPFTRLIPVRFEDDAGNPPDTRCSIVGLPPRP